MIGIASPGGPQTVGIAIDFSFATQPLCSGTSTIVQAIRGFHCPHSRSSHGRCLRTTFCVPPFLDTNTPHLVWRKQCAVANTRTFTRCKGTASAGAITAVITLAGVFNSAKGSFCSLIFQLWPAATLPCQGQFHAKFELHAGLSIKVTG